LGRSERDAVRNQVRRIIEHLLKLAYSSLGSRASTGWRRSSRLALSWATRFPRHCDGTPKSCS
jgi:hypothetical protein